MQWENNGIADWALPTCRSGAAGKHSISRRSVETGAGAFGGVPVAPILSPESATRTPEGIAAACRSTPASSRTANSARRGGLRTQA